MAPLRSAALELRPALLREGLHALLVVLAVEAGGDQPIQHREVAVGGRPEQLLHGGLGRAQGERGVARHRQRVVPGEALEVRLRHHLVHQPHAQRVLGAEVGARGEEELLGVRGADQVHQLLHPAVVITEAEPGGRDAEARVVRRDAPVAGDRDADAAADAEAVDHREQRLAERGQRLRSGRRDAPVLLLVGRVAPAVLEVGDVGAGHEGGLARPGEDDAPDRVVGRELPHVLGHALPHLLAHRVALVRLVEGDPADRAVLLHQQRLGLARHGLAHGRSLLGSGCRSPTGVSRPPVSRKCGIPKLRYPRWPQPRTMSRPSHRAACQAFRWEESARAMGFTGGAPVNLGRAIVDRHAGSGRVALRWFGKRGEARTYTFDELARLTARFANVLRELGVSPGDRIPGFLPRIPEMLVAMIGTWEGGAVSVPIFPGFGPDAIEFRVRHSGARGLVTQREQRARFPEPLPDGVTVITVTGGGAGAPGDVDFGRIMQGQAGGARLADVRREDHAGLLYTSGSTGPPKGVKIAPNFPGAIRPPFIHRADLRPDDVFWPTGDPGWGYGLVCYMGALALGVPVLSHEAAPTPEFCLARLRELGVSNLATTPTLLPGVMALGAAAAGGC